MVWNPNNDPSTAWDPEADPSTSWSPDSPPGASWAEGDGVPVQTEAKSVTLGITNMPQLLYEFHLPDTDLLLYPTSIGGSVPVSIAVGANSFQLDFTTGTTHVLEPVAGSGPFNSQFIWSTGTGFVQLNSSLAGKISGLDIVLTYERLVSLVSVRKTFQITVGAGNTFLGFLPEPPIVGGTVRIHRGADDPTDLLLGQDEEATGGLLIEPLVNGSMNYRTGFLSGTFLGGVTQGSTVTVFYRTFENASHWAA